MVNYGTTCFFFDFIFEHRRMVFREGILNSKPFGFCKVYPRFCEVWQVPQIKLATDPRTVYSRSQPLIQIDDHIVRRFYNCTHAQGWQHKSRLKRANTWHENHVIDILRARPFVVQNRERCPHFVHMVAELNTSPYLSLWPVAIENCWIGTAIYKLQRLIFGNYILGTQV